MMNLLIIAICLGVASAQSNDFLYAWSSQCGPSLKDWNIIGGEIAETNEYPWMLSLQVYTEGSHYCGASLITDRFALTAAHCVSGQNPNIFLVAFGEQDLGDSRDDVVYRNVADITVHGSYNPFSLDNDIALLEFDQPITFSDKIRPVCAPDPNNDNDGDTATVSGWGNISDGIFPDYPDELYYIDIPVISNQECDDDYGGGSITGNMICAGLKYSKDACQGDSGGPMWVEVGGMPSQVGIVSWGIGCADGYPGVYTRVNQYVDWVSARI